jgi:hypothetical protein
LIFNLVCFAANQYKCLPGINSIICTADWLSWILAYLFLVLPVVKAV